MAITLITDRDAEVKRAMLARHLDHARCIAGQAGLHDLARDIVSLVVKHKISATYDETAEG